MNTDLDVKYTLLRDLAALPLKERLDQCKKHRKSFRLGVSGYGIENSAWNVDIAHSYLTIAFVGQRLSAHAHPRIALRTRGRIDEMDLPVVVLEFEIRNIVDFAAEVAQLVVLDRDPETEEEEALHEELTGSIQAFGDLKLRRGIAFPEAYDEYISNQLAGIGDVWFENEEDLKQWKDDVQPSWRHGFIQSSFSFGRDGSVYISPAAYVFTGNIDIATVLQRSSGISLDDERFLDCCAIEITGLPKLIVNGIETRVFPSEDVGRTNQLLETLGCDLINPLSEFQGTHDLSILAHKQSNVFVLLYPSERQHIKRPVREVAASRGLLLVESLGVDVRAEIALDWGTIDDERFEGLCYDILRLSGRFDPDSIQKMGSSRTPDGGRDFVVHQVLWPRHRGVTWIAQSKLLRSRRSIGKAVLDGVIEMLEEYGADGYCLLTTGLVNERLWDRLNKLSEVRKFEYEVWDRLRIERFLRLHPDIRNECFRNSSNPARRTRRQLRPR